MALTAKDIVVDIRQQLFSTFKIIYRSGYEHPLVWGAVFFLFVVYRYVPSLFSLAVSSSPVIFCTAVLLGTLLLYGESNNPQTEEQKRVSSRNDGNSANGTIIKKGENLSSNEGMNAACSRTVGNEGNKKELSGQNRVDGEEEMDEGEGSGKRQYDKKPYFGSSVCSSPWMSVNGHDDSSRSLSDNTENSSPDASVADIIPMLDELHPLLDSDAPQPALRSLDDSDIASSCGTSQNEESDDGSIEEDEDEVEIPEDEDEEANKGEGKDGAHEAVVKWTADDQKNVMDLGTSELERNQRLEHLLAKRRARKFLSFHADKNLIDFESIDPVLKAEDRPRVVTFQIPSICAPRRNPFDLPFEKEHSTGLPPIPGSAPSVLELRSNPFNHPYDQELENCSLTRPSINQQVDSVIKPYCVPQRGPGFVSVQRESSEMDDSKVSSSNESDTASSHMDWEHHEELVEQQLLQESRSVSPTNRHAESIEQNSQSSEEDEQIGANRDKPDLTSNNTDLVNSGERVHEFDGEDKERPNAGGIWVAPPSLSLVDEYESRSREINEIKERDVIQVELPAISDDFAPPVSPVLSKLAFPPRLSLPGTLSDNPLMIEATASFNSSYSVKPPTPRDVPTVLHSQRVSLDRLQMSMADLPPIPEEHLENLIVEDTQERVIDPSRVSVDKPHEEFAQDDQLILEKDVGDSLPSAEESSSSNNNNNNNNNKSGSKTSNGKHAVKTLGKLKNMAKLKFKY